MTAMDAVNDPAMSLRPISTSDNFAISDIPVSERLRKATKVNLSIGYMSLGAGNALESSSICPPMIS